MTRFKSIQDAMLERLRFIHKGSAKATLLVAEFFDLVLCVDWSTFECTCILNSIYMKFDVKVKYDLTREIEN